MGGLILYGSGSFDAYYAHEVHGQPVQLEELTVQYKDYATWQRTHVQDQTLQAHADYWKDNSRGLSPLSCVPTTQDPPTWTTEGTTWTSRCLKSCPRP